MVNILQLDVGPPSSLPIGSHDNAHYYHKSHSILDLDVRIPQTPPSLLPRRRRHIHGAIHALSLDVSSNLGRFLLICLSFLLLCSQIEAYAAVQSAPVAPTVTLLASPYESAAPMALLARQDSASPSSSSSSSSSSLSASSTSLLAAPTSEASLLPNPFDTSLGNNFTSQACPVFFSSFLNNQTFQSCRPLSLLLRTSSGFFAASRSLVSLTSVLQASCDVNFEVCSTLMASLASELAQQSNCGEDLAQRNPVVTEAYDGLLAYQPLFHAGCLTDSNGGYCYADAVLNVSSPSSGYIYYVPIGVTLPNTAQPACTTCLHSTMAVFAQTATNNSKSLLASYYNPTAQQINSHCGATFAETAVKGLGVPGLNSGSGVRTALLLLAAAFLIQVFS